MKGWSTICISDNCDSHIKFTVETVKDYQVAFLDCMITINDGSLQSSVYRKATHKDHVLFDSHHPLVHKLGVIRTLYYSASYIPSKEEARGNEHQDNISAKHCGRVDISLIRTGASKRPFTLGNARARTLLSVRPPPPPPSPKAWEFRFDISGP